EVARLCPRRDHVPIAAGGTRIAFAVRCFGTPPHIAVRDLAGGAPVDVPLDGATATLQVRLAGDQLAWLDAVPGDAEPREAVTVLDLATGARRVAWEGPDALGFDVRPDGTVAVADAPSPDAQTTLTLIDGTDAERVLAHGIGGYVRFAGLDRLVADRPVDGNRGERAVLLIGADGTEREILRLAASPASTAGARWDVDDRRLVWVDVTCAYEATIWQADLSALDRPVGARSPTRCRELGLQTEEAAVDRRGRFTVELFCPTGCRGRLRVGHYADEPKARARFDLPPSALPQPVALRFAERVPLRLRRGKAKRMRGQLVTDVRHGIWDPYRFELSLVPRR
ncbi:MAG TPA: hypothetical protein VIL49_13695, partial [Capillimicrobium sp.]